MSTDDQDSWEDIHLHCWKALAPNPDGSPPNFNAPTFQPIAIGVVTSLTVVTIFAVGMRIAGALRKDSRLHFEDYSSVLALVFTIANSVLDVLEDDQSHVWNTSQCSELNIAAAKRNAALLLLYPCGLVCAKSAICVLYMRLFGCVKHVRYSALGILILTVLSFIVAMALGITYSFPWRPEWEWGRDRPDTYSMRHYIVLFGIITVITDFVLLALPIRSIVKLNASVRKRIGLVAIFTAGFGAAIAASVNLYFRVGSYYGNVYDYTWYDALLGLTADIELYITISLGCIPGCVAAWRNRIRDSAAITRLRSRIRGSKGFTTTGMSPLDTIYEVNPKFGKGARTNYGDSALTNGNGMTDMHGLSITDDIERQHHNAMALEGVVIAQRKMEERIRREEHERADRRLFTFLSDGRESR